MEPAEQIRQIWVVDPMAPATPLPVPALHQRRLDTIPAPLNAPTEAAAGTS